MNVFVLSTGRCGSMTFSAACKSISNYSSAHESRSAMLGRARLDYPKNHIEIDNRLSWFLGRLDAKYGDDAFYVHLRRNDQDTARSCVKRYSSGIIKAYREEVLIGLLKESDPMAVSLDYCNTVNSNIECFLRGKSKKISISLEDIDRGFTRFWEMIEARGDLDSALKEFSVSYNATKDSKSLLSERSTERGLAGFSLKAIRKAERLITKLPSYIRNA